MPDRLPEPGERIRLLAPLPQDPNSPPVGSTASVVAVRAEVGQIDVKWDGPYGLILLTEDPFEIVNGTTT